MRYNIATQDQARASTMPKTRVEFQIAHVRRANTTPLQSETIILQPWSRYKVTVHDRVETGFPRFTKTEHAMTTKVVYRMKRNIPFPYDHADFQIRRRSCGKVRR